MSEEKKGFFSRLKEGLTKQEIILCQELMPFFMGLPK